MSIYAFGLKENNYQSGWRWYESFLTPEECDQLIAEHSHIEPHQGSIVTGPDQEVDSEIAPDVRNVSIKTVSLDTCPWIYAKLNDLVWDANLYYNYDLTGFMEQMQLLHYGEDIDGGHYHLHQDHGAGALSTRKLTVIVQLTDPSEYEGCELEVVCCGIGPKNKGDVVVFPSYTPHSVSPLTKGNRNSLVVWVNGPPYR
jgi:PKHD-type hydroxylase